MYSDARDRYPHLYQYRYSGEELRTLPIKVLVADKGQARRMDARDGNSLLGKDPRVTRTGQWLRRTSLDELPNLLNVLKGDMHLVGPRPDIVDNMLYYSQRELGILNVKPGITGHAQIKGRGFLTFEQTNACDLAYVENRSLLLDLKILLMTIPALLKRHGAF
jgi:lipopolysaccharide/colanic/teichoic acid biosynthesis glycosyltransferase